MTPETAFPLLVLPAVVSGIALFATALLLLFVPVALPATGNTPSGRFFAVIFFAVIFFAVIFFAVIKEPSP